ncbi:antirestriction protein ArdC [Advenella incenata]|uniref:Antirestriction protein ArdC n=1 Tax=Advenella incenata TaxID=267800 RepID=A0A4Q7V8Y2_9BURK|nr:zincin-like metallopeptidase domain-containing protein [Advenella incenata]RZT91068.1 antirestriction protein ArdC [Advenella incenata]
MAEKKPAFHEQLAEKIITQLQAGTAPWQRPWDAPLISMPYNESTGKSYRGSNVLNLMLAGYADPRWLTFNQAKERGYRVNKGEKGSLIQTFRFHEEKQLRDDEGKPVKDPKGNAVIEQTKLNKPIIRTFVVFNAEQITGVPPLERTEHQWNGVEQIDKLLAASGAQIDHQAGNRAYYSPSQDMIVLPLKEQFPDPERYYSTALHELGHWTGHESRLNRPFVNSFGSEGYAREELRAEISSMLVGQRLGISHDPGQHMSYVDSWVKILKEDPAEITRACQDAEKIHNYLSIYLERTADKAEQDKVQSPEKTEQSMKEIYEEKFKQLPRDTQDVFMTMEVLMRDVVKHMPTDQKTQAYERFYTAQAHAVDAVLKQDQELEVER